MINIFQQTYDERLKKWYELRSELEGQSVETICIQVDKFWQAAPLVNHYLHPDSVDEWPTPWELVFDNNFCVYARALGMIYTLLLLGIKDIELVDALDDNNESVVLVLVDRAKYTLNYWPNTVVNNNLQDFRIVRHIDLSGLLNAFNK